MLPSYISKELRFHDTLCMFLAAWQPYGAQYSYVNPLAPFLPLAESSAIERSSARETLHSAEAPAGSEKAYTDCAIQGTRDFRSVVYPFVYIFPLKASFETKIPVVSLVTIHQSPVVELLPLSDPLTPSTDIIENCLFIIWRHLDFYFLHCIPSDEERRMLGGPTLTSSRLRKLQGIVG